MFDFSNYSAKSKFYDNSNKLMDSKMKDLVFQLKKLLDWSQKCVHSRCKIVVIIDKQTLWMKMLLRQ